MSTLSNNDIAHAIYLVSKDTTGAEQSAILDKVVKFLNRKHLLSKSASILGALEKIINHAEGKLAVTVKSVQKLEHKTKEHIIQTLKKRYSTKEIVLVEKLDPELLGGIWLEINDEVIDLSMKNRLTKLEEYLTRNHE